ncbi:MAG: PAS domain S-box protein [Pirellulaceae bacterium]
MADKRTSHDSHSKRTLRQRAEELVTASFTDIRRHSTEELQRLVHEFQVHQIELELQNEELRRTQFELAEARDRYSDLYEFAPVGYLTIQKNGQILEANLTATTLLCIERGKLLNRKFTDFLPPESYEVWQMYLRDVFRNQGLQRCELDMLTAEGTRMTIRLESLVACDTDGVPVWCRTTIIDVSQQKAAEFEVRQLNATLEQRVAEQTNQIRLLAEAISHLGEGVLITDSQLEPPGPTILFANDAICQISGYGRVELVGKTPRILQGSDRSPGVKPNQDVYAGQAFLRIN